MKFSLQSLLLISLSFLVGFSVMVIELLSTRIIAPIIGSSVFTWTSVIGITLLGLALGSWAGGLLADKYHSAKILPYTLLISAVFVFLIPTLAEHTSFIINSVESVLILNIALSIYLFLLPMCALGTILPFILKLATESMSSLGTTYGRLSFAWSTGSLLGVFLCGFFLISYFGSKETIFGISLLLVFLGVLLGYKHKKFLGVALLSAIAAITLGKYIPTLESKVGLLVNKETNYYSLKVIDTYLSEFGKSRVLFLDLDLHSLDSSEVNTSFYPEVYPLFAVLKNNISEILVIGGGAYTLPKHFDSYYKDARVTVMEIDPELTEIANEYFDLNSYDIRTIPGDARFLLRKDPKQYDIIFGDAYNSLISVPWYLLTLEWNEVVKSKLTKDGIYAINFISTIDGAGAKFTESIIHTFKQSFPQYFVFPLGETSSTTQNIILIGVNGIVPIREERLRQLLQSSNNEENRFLAKKLLPRNTLTATSAIILTDNFSPTDKLLSPVIKNYMLNSLTLIETILGNSK